jgi:DNA polymerase III sliding clamp (beta) subunit (PCNA family)
MIPRFDFITALKFVSHASGVLNVRHYLNGVLFRFGSCFLELVATDGHRIAQVSLDSNAGGGSPFGDYIVKRGSVDGLLKACKVKKSDADTDQIGFTDHGGALSAFWGGSFYEFERIESRFPDFERIVPRGKPKDGQDGFHTIGINAAYLAQAAKALGLLTNQKHKVIEMNFYQARSAIVMRAVVDKRFSSVRAGALVAIMPMRL